MRKRVIWKNAAGEELGPSDIDNQYLLNICSYLVRTGGSTHKYLEPWMIEAVFDEANKRKLILPIHCSYSEAIKSYCDTHNVKDAAQLEELAGLWCKSTKLSAYDYVFYDDVKENKKEKSMDKSEIRVIIQNSFANEFNSKKEEETAVKDKKIKNSSWYKAVTKCYSDLYASDIELKKMEQVPYIDYLFGAFPFNNEVYTIMNDYEETLRKLRETNGAELKKVLALLDICETYEQVRDLLAEYNIVSKM